MQAKSMEQNKEEFQQVKSDKEFNNLLFSWIIYLICAQRIESAISRVRNAQSAGSAESVHTYTSIRSLLGWRKEPYTLRSCVCVISLNIGSQYQPVRTMLNLESSLVLTWFWQSLSTVLGISRWNFRIREPTVYMYALITLHRCLGGFNPVPSSYKFSSNTQWITNTLFLQIKHQIEKLEQNSKESISYLKTNIVMQSEKVTSQVMEFLSSRDLLVRVSEWRFDELPGDDRRRVCLC